MIRSRRRRAILLVAFLLAAGCGTSGKDLRSPPSGVTSPAPTTSTSTTLAPVFTVMSSAFAYGSELPERFTCKGDDISPPLQWTPASPDTVELAITVTNPTSGSVYWVVTGIAPGSTEIAEGSVPLEAAEGPNSAGGFGWHGPCPEPGETQSLDITVHALASPSSLDPSMSATDANAQLQGLPGTRTVASATVTGI